jgi:hypothetical protein|tara:strand:+ start:43 stop:609 length:567 start_codon:yes stop_codon:yes gene_type:complete
MSKKKFSFLAKIIRLPLRFIKHLLTSILNNFSQSKTISANESLKVIVVSTGGVATTTLIKYLKLYTKVNHENDNDGYKHLIKFPFLQNGNTKIIYIYGSYEKIFKSLKRRKIFLKQMVKLGCPLCFFFTGKLEKFFFKRCIKRQINNFKDNSEVFCLEFDNIWKEKNKIKNFLKIDSPNFIKNFPSKK